MRLHDLLTLPSALTLLRLLLAAAMPFWVGGPWVLPMYLLAIATDIFDGVLARRTGTATRAGAAFDGWVDKVLHVNLGWALAVADVIPDWFLLAWCARELVQGPLVPVLVHRFRTAKAPEPRTSFLGRATAVLLFGSVVLVLVGRDATALTLLTGAAGLAAGLQYAWFFLHDFRMKEKRPVPATPPGDYPGDKPLTA